MYCAVFSNITWSNTLLIYEHFSWARVIKEWDQVDFVAIT